MGTGFPQTPDYSISPSGKPEPHLHQTNDWETCVHCGEPWNGTKPLQAEKEQDLPSDEEVDAYLNKMADGFKQLVSKEPVADVPQEKSQQGPETDLSGAVKNTGTAIDEIRRAIYDRVVLGLDQGKPYIKNLDDAVAKLQQLIDKQVRVGRVDELNYLVIHNPGPATQNAYITTKFLKTVPERIKELQAEDRHE